VNRKIVTFHQDEEQHWVADLECGHSQHTRHRPPFEERPWVLDPALRQKRIGTELSCKLCDEEADDH